MISNDRRIYNAGSETSKRMIMLGDFTDSLKILILGLDGKPTFLSPKVEVIPAGRNKLFAVFNSLIIAGKLKKKNSLVADVVTTHDPFLAGLAGFFIKKIFGVKLQIQSHTDIMNPHFRGESFSNYLRYKLGLFLIPKADSVRVVSNRAKNSLVSKFNLKIGVLPVFVDLEKIRKTPAKFNLHDKYPQYDFIILMVSRFAREKNIEMAISAMAEIIKKHPRTGLLIVGHGPMLKYYKAEIKKLNLDDSVKIESWTNDVISYYKTVDLFILTSNYEGYGLVLAEAMVSGCPVVSTDVGIADEIIKNGQNGFVIKVGDKVALAGAILELMENKELLAEMRQNNLNAHPVPYQSAQSYFADYVKLLEEK